MKYLKQLLRAGLAVVMTVCITEYVTAELGRWRYRERCRQIQRQVDEHFGLV